MTDIENKEESPVEAATASVPPQGAEPQASDVLADTLRAERDKAKEQLLRTAADFENFRKRARKDLEDARRRAAEDAIKEVLPIVDNLERAIQASEGATDVKAVLDGVRMVLRLFDDSASRMGLERLKVVGTNFDPSLHDAIQQEETDEQAPGTVLREITAGYRLGERLVRPALVVVARPKPAAPTEATPAAEGQSEPS